MLRPYGMASLSDLSGTSAVHAQSNDQVVYEARSESDSMPSSQRIKQVLREHLHVEL